MKYKGEASAEQIQAWKEEHGEINCIKVEDHICYLKKPSRKTLGYASMAGKNDPFMFNEVILKNCWLGGDEAIKTDDTLFLSACPQIAEMIEIKKSSLEKL